MSETPADASLSLPLAPVETSETRDVLARLYGQPVLAFPKDLYIPPDALEVVLDAFEGPLDLLLYLIRKNNLNILDIPMAALTTQYLTYVEAMRQTNLALAADYLLMAAILLEIKSRMLLPRPAKAQEDDEEDPRAELIRRLVEYEQMKLAALRLDTLPRVSRDFEWVGVLVAEHIVERQPEVSLHDLQLAWLKIMQKARLNQHHTVSREALSVREHMTQILRMLSDGAFVVFDALFKPEEGRPALVVSFLAVLELVKEKLVEVTQVEAFAPIYVRVRHVGTEPS